MQDPLLTILIPAMNERITIGEFVDWCKEGLQRSGINGQILIVDSSNDETREIALAHGAEVLSVPARGLGRAYIDAIPHVRGKFIIMGDADLTYDTRFIEPFLEKFNQGYEFIMGSRFKGKIEKDAMPVLHQYFGTPLTTWILNLVYGSRFSDIHCGMRGITLDALKRLQLQSQSWQYASEMIIKSIHLNLKSTEVPVIFHKDRQGRVSHHKRVGWYAPWAAGWINLKSIFTFGADFFLFKTGFLMALIGLVGTVFLYHGPLYIDGISLQLHWMLLFLLIFLVGLQFFFMGILAKVLYDLEMQRSHKWKKFFSLDYVIPSAICLIVAGIFNMWPLLMEYVHSGLLLASIDKNSYRAIAGIGLIVSGAMYFTSALLCNGIVLITRK